MLKYVRIRAEDGAQCENEIYEVKCMKTFNTHTFASKRLWRRINGGSGVGDSLNDSTESLPPHDILYARITGGCFFFSRLLLLL